MNSQVPAEHGDSLSQSINKVQRIILISSWSLALCRFHHRKLSKYPLAAVLLSTQSSSTESRFGDPGQWVGSGGYKDCLAREPYLIPSVSVKGKTPSPAPTRHRVHRPRTSAGTRPRPFQLAWLHRRGGSPSRCLQQPMGPKPRPAPAAMHFGTRSPQLTPVGRRFSSRRP